MKNLWCPVLLVAALVVALVALPEPAGHAAASAASGRTSVEDATALPVEMLTRRGRWVAAADDYLGGASDVALTWSDAGLGANGTLRAGFAFPYAGGMWSAGEIPMQPVDRRGWSTLKLVVSGEVDVLRVMFFSGQSTRPVWRDVRVGEVEIPLEKLAGLDLAAFQAVGVFAAGSTGEFDFTIEAARLE